MTVSELIARLETMDPDTKVLVRAGEHFDIEEVSRLESGFVNVLSGNFWSAFEGRPLNAVKAVILG